MVRQPVVQPGRVECAPIHEDSSLGPGEQNAVATGVTDGHDHTVFIFHDGGKIEWHVVAIGDLCRSTLTAKSDGQRVDAPLCNIDMMGTPIRHLAPGILLPPAEGVV